MTESLGFVNLLHIKGDLSDNAVDKLWDLICENSDGVDVEKMRSDRGLSNTSKERREIIERLRYVSKSKLSTLGWDQKEFQAGYIFGLTGVENELMRMGTNNHTIQEILPEYIEADDIVNEYENKSTIEPYIEKQSKQIMVDIIENAVGKSIGSFDECMKYLEDGEKSMYERSIDCIAYNYQKRFKYLNSIYPINKSIKMLLPLWREVIIYDEREWLSGVVDGIYKAMVGVKPVDYKFGKPKEKYYEKGIALEMTFYKFLITSASAVYCLEFDGERKKWKPLHAETGEMWYILDKEKGTNVIKYSDKWDLQFHTAVQTYWRTLDTMSYAFEPYFGGWNKRSRFDEYCNKKTLLDSWSCSYRSVCDLSDSFKNEMIISEVDKLV